MKRLGVFCSVVGGAMLLNSSVVFAGILDAPDLTETDKTSILSGQQVSKFDDVAGSALPKGRVYQLIHGATPEDAAAVFNNAELFPKYLSKIGVKNVKIKSQDRNSCVLHYTVMLPMNMGTAEYDAHNVATTYDEGASYQFAWIIDPTSYIKSANGSARFEKVGPDTLIEYTNLLSPRWDFPLSWAIAAAKKQLKDTVKEIVKEIERQKTSDPSLLQQEIDILKEMLATQTFHS